MDRVASLDDSFFLRLRTGIPRGSGCSAAEVLFLSIDAVMGEGASLKIQLGI